MAGWEEYNQSPTDNTNTLLLVWPNLQSYGSIGCYTKAAGVYHCPGDASVDPAYGPRVRSCSMNGMVGHVEPTGDGFQPDFVGYQTFLKATDFKKLSPSSAWVFLDERANSIDDGWFYVDPQGYSPSSSTTALTVKNLPAVYHKNCSSFSFADGHAEIHKWFSGSFAALSGNEQSPTYTTGQAGFNGTCWLIAHATTSVP